MEGKTRYINEEVINFTALGQDLAEKIDGITGRLIPITRQTMAKRFQGLLELGLIKYHTSSSEQDWKTVYSLDSISN